MGFESTYEGPQTAFRGGDKGFIRGHYPIWYDGLPADYTGEGNINVVTNWYSLRSGLPVRSQLKHPSAAAQSGAQRLIKYFEDIIKKEREREIGIIQTYLNNLKGHQENLQFEAIQLAEQALQQNELSTAYTWIMKYQSNIEALKNEVQHPKNNNFANISHMNAFWKDEFSNFVASLFNAKNRDTTDDYTLNIEDMSAEGIVEAYIKQVLDQGDSDLVHNIESIQESMVSTLKDLLTKAGIDPNTQDIFSKENFNALAGYRAAHKRKSPSGVVKMAKTTKGKIKEIAELLGYEAGRGMGQELAVTARGSKHGSTIATGQILKETLERKGMVQIKTDVYQYTVAEGTVDINALIAPLAEAAAARNWELYNTLKQKINEQALASGVEIFEVAYNVKGYKSRRDMFIAQGGSFETRTSQLRAIADTGAIPDDMFDKIVFLLYNTASGCILDGNIDFLKLYLGIACAVWFFDDYMDIDVYAQARNSGINTVHIFASGGNYYTLSEILSTVVEQLREYILTAAQGDDLFDITIMPPAINAAAEYQSIVDDNKDAMNAARQEEDESTIQELLQQRWDAMRNLVASNGYMEIKVRQNKLEELLNMFETYLRT